MVGKAYGGLRSLRSMCASGRLAANGSAEEGDDDRANEHETEHVETVVEGLEIGFAAYGAVEGDDRLLARGVRIAAAGREFLGQRGETFLTQRIVRADR